MREQPFGGIGTFADEHDEVWKVLVCNWLHFVRQNHFYVMLLINQGCCLYSESICRLCVSRRFYAEFKTEKLNPLYLFGRPCQPS
jgi:hypothetical protein